MYIYILLGVAHHACLYELICTQTERQYETIYLFCCKMIEIYGYMIDRFWNYLAIDIDFHPTSFPRLKPFLPTDRCGSRANDGAATLGAARKPTGGGRQVDGRSLCRSTQCLESCWVLKNRFVRTDVREWTWWLLTKWHFNKMTWNYKIVKKWWMIIYYIMIIICNDDSYLI